MVSETAYALAFGIGALTGLRSMTTPAAVSWAAHLNWMRLTSSKLEFFGNSGTLYAFTAMAIGELIADKFSFIPSRKSPGPFIWRILVGGVTGAAVCVAGAQSLAAGVVLGALGGVAGTLGGYQARVGLVRMLKVPDYVVALVEDAIAVGGSYLVVSRFV